MTGKFIISLDFELLWGMRDHETPDSYGSNIIGVREALPKMLDVFSEYDVKATIATVGLLFSSNKRELESFFPEVRPQYEDKNLSPYNGYLNNVKNSEEQDKYHFASNLIDLIRTYPGHEISTHTFSHYYCLENGQSIDEFRADLESAVEIAKTKNIELRSIIFPRNQINPDYLKVCHDLGITSYRGNERVWFYKEDSRGSIRLHKRLFRMIDTYINISGHHTYPQESTVNESPMDFRSSRFLRPYSQKLKAFEHLRIKRICDSMTYAAKAGEVYHIWWHPHNFGANSKQNFEALIKILKHYKELNVKYKFESCTMEGLSQILEGTMN